MSNLLKCPWLRSWHLPIFLAFWSFYIPPALGLVFWHVDCYFLLCWFWYCNSNFPVCSFVDTCMLDLFSTATCSADFVLGVRLCFWVRHFGFYSLGSLLPLSLLMQFKMRLLCMSLFHSFFPFLLSFSISCHHFPPQERDSWSHRRLQRIYILIV